MQYAMLPLATYLLTPEKLKTGHDRLREIIHRGGITTIGDMGGGGYPGFPNEVAAQAKSFGDKNTPFRVILAPGRSERPPEKRHRFNGRQIRSVRAIVDR